MTQQKPIATLKFEFFKDCGLGTKIDFDEKDLRTLNRETLIPIMLARYTQGVVSDLLEGGTFGELIGTHVEAMLRINDEE